MTMSGERLSNSRELARSKPGPVPGHRDHHHVQPEAQTQARDAVVAGVARGGDHALDTAFAEAARDHDGVEPPQAVRAEQVGHQLGVDPVELHLGAVVEAGVAQGLDHRHVGIGHVDVLADDPDLHPARQRLHPVDERLPVGDVDRVGRLVDAEGAAHVGVESLLVQDERDLVDARRVDGRDDGVDGDVALQRDLALQALGDGLVAPADDDVGLDTAAAQLRDRVLRGLRLLLARHEVRHQREVHVADVVPADIPAKLPNCLNEGDDLDVADRPADLDDDDVDVLVGQALDAVLDLVRHVRDDLHGAPEEVAAALLLDDRAVDATGGGVGALGEVLVDEALVVAEVEVGLTAVLGDEDLAVLPRVHRSRGRR